MVKIKLKPPSIDFYFFFLKKKLLGCLKVSILHLLPKKEPKLFILWPHFHVCLPWPVQNRLYCEARMWATHLRQPGNAGWKQASGDTPQLGPHNSSHIVFSGKLLLRLMEDLSMSVFLSLIKIPSSLPLHPCSIILKWASGSDRLGQGSRSVSNTGRFLVPSETPAVFVCFFFFSSFVQCEVTVTYWGLSLVMCHMPNTF